MTSTKPSLSEITAFLKREFPQSKCMVDAVGNKSATIRHNIGEAELRPGGTVSGPVMMFVADVALYVAILGEIGIVPLTFEHQFPTQTRCQQSHHRRLQTHQNRAKLGDW
jgi:acyl-coenzyme A thioesterase PaaI-like protein